MQIRKDLITEMESIIAASKEAVDHQRVIMYWKVGQKIVEEQRENDRAGYGDAFKKSLARSLEPTYSSSFSFRQPNLFRQFYRSLLIVSALRSRSLIWIEKKESRGLYTAETEKNNRTAWQRERHINSQLFERLLMSKEVASKYQLYLPSKQQLIEEMKKEMLNIEPTNKEQMNEGKGRTAKDKHPVSIVQE